jgi:hypothetical protein
MPTKRRPRRNPEEVTMPGFGSRGGMRQMGVIRQDEPMEKLTANMPKWNPPTGNKEKVPTTPKPRS